MLCLKQKKINSSPSRKGSLFSPSFLGFVNGMKTSVSHRAEISLVVHPFGDVVKRQLPKKEGSLGNHCC